MYSQDTSVRNILNDYLKEERFLENKIKQCEEKRFNVERDSSYNEDAVCNFEIKNPSTICTVDHGAAVAGSSQYDDAGLRNRRFLKDLEEAKARLRTIASFTPTDQELRVLAGAYRGLLGNVEQLTQLHK